MPNLSKNTIYHDNNDKTIHNLLSLENPYGYRGSYVSNLSSKIKKPNLNISQKENKNVIVKHNKTFVIEKLFPYKYYFCSVFIRNITIMKENCLFSSRFLKIYTFLGQLFDITTYLCLQREFNALKSIFNDDNRNFIEDNKKININSKNFINDISDCIGGQKLYILAQRKNED